MQPAIFFLLPRKLEHSCSRSNPVNQQVHSKQTRSWRWMRIRRVRRIQVCTAGKGLNNPSTFACTREHLLLLLFFCWGLVQRTSSSFGSKTSTRRRFALDLYLRCTPTWWRTSGTTPLPYHGNTVAAIFRFFRRIRRPFFDFFFAGASTCFLWRWRKNRSVFWHLLVSFCDDGGNFFCLGLKKRRSWRLNVLKQLPTARRASFLVARSRHRRGSVKLGTFGFHDHVNEASKVFLRHFLCCASSFRPVAFRENQMLIWTFFGHMWSDVHWCLSLLVFLSPVEDGGWFRSRSQKRQRRTDILRLLGTFVSFFFLKKKRSHYFQ